MIGSKYRLTNLALAIAATAIVAAGCGTSEYMQRVQQGLGGMKAGAVFNTLYEKPSEIPGTPVVLRLPKFIGESKAFTEQSAEPNGQGNVKPERLQPPFLKIPGLRVCYQMATIDDSTGVLMPYYCYLGALPAGQPAPDGKPIEESILAQVVSAFPNTQPWSSIACPTPSGASIPWQSLTANGAQDFLDPSGNPVKVDGVFRLFTSEIGGWRVLIGWRAPQGLAQRLDVAAAVAGTVGVGQAGAANQQAQAAGAAAAVPVGDRNAQLPGAGVGAAAVGVVPGITP
jgi:hypothetical protein